MLANIRSPKQDSEKKIVLCKKGDDITRLDGNRNKLVTIYKNFISNHDFFYEISSSLW
jgi:hypothetical protein